LRKIKLLQVGSTTFSEGFTTYSAGVYFKRVSLSDPDRLLSPVTTIFSGTFDDSLPSSDVSITGVLFNNVPLSEVGAISELYLQDSSFYFDFASQFLYISLFDYDNVIQGDVITIGETIGFISEAQNIEVEGNKYPLDTFLGSVYYEPRLNDISIVNDITNQQEGIFVYDDLDVSINNSDGTFDLLRTDITGNVIELSVADLSDSKEEEIGTGFPFKLAAQLSDFRVVRKAVVEDVDYSNPNEPNISAIDQRANWTQKINSNLLTQTEFAGLPDKFNNKYKPILMGTVNGAKCIPLRADGAAASFDYFICDTTYGDIQSISSVYFNGEISGVKEDRFLTGGEYSVNTSTGIITVNNVNKGDVWVYGVFTTLSETVEILLYLLSTFENIAYIDSNFNKEEIEIIKALDRTTHIYIDEKGEVLSRVIEKLCTDIQVDLLQIGGVLTLRESNTVGVVQEAIPTRQIIDNPPPWSTNRIDTVKSIAVTYNSDYRLDIAETYFNNSEEATAVLNNRKAVDKSFETNLTLEADVQEIYDIYYNRYIQTLRTVTINRTVPFMAGISDFISFPVVRQSLDEDKTIFTNAVYKIIQIDEIENTALCVYFEDARDIELIIEWDITPIAIYEWDDTANIFILEAN
jgi:hypothetical protein